MSYARSRLPCCEQLCVENRKAYLKILALDYDPTDAHHFHKEKWIPYTYVVNERRITASEHETLGVMKRQIALWDAPLTEDFVTRLGEFANGEVIMKSEQRKRDAEKADLRASKVAAISHASISSHGIYRAPSPPPLADLLPDLPPINTVDFSCPPSQQPVFHHTQIDDTLQAVSHHGQHDDQQTFGVRIPTHLGVFTSNFDLAFATWLNKKNISKATIDRLLKDPAMAPPQKALSWKSVKQMREKVNRLETNQTS